MVHITPHPKPKLPPMTMTTLDIVNKLNEINLSYGCSVDKIQKALDILKIIKEKERE